MSSDESQQPEDLSRETASPSPSAASPHLENGQPQTSYAEREQIEPDLQSRAHATALPGEAAQAYGAYLPAPSAKTNRGRLISFAIIAVVVAGGTGTYATLGHSSSSAGSSSTLAGAATTGITAPGLSDALLATPPISLPSGVPDLLLLTNGNAQEEVSRVRSGVETERAIYNNVLVGAYGPQANGGYRLVLVDQSITNLPSDERSQFLSYTPSGLVQGLVSAVHMSETQVENSSDPSAALSCGMVSYVGHTVPTCIWDDSESFGFAYFFTQYYTTGLSDAANYTDALRSAAEAG